MKPDIFSRAGSLSTALTLAVSLTGSSFGVQFTDVGGEVLNFSTSGITRSVSLADYDNDGDLDLLYQGSQSQNSLGRRFYQNQLKETGELDFVEKTSETGIIASDTSGWSAAWADINGDGFVDVFLGESNFSPARGDLFLNQSGSNFADVSSTTVNDPGFHQNVGWADVNNDQRLDLVLAMEGPEEHEIYLQNEDFTFTASGASLGLQVPYGTKAYGTAIADADNDGDLDLYVSTCRNIGNIPNNFFRNNLVPDGVVSFTDIANSNGTQYMDNSYHAEFQDFDNDGWLDLFMVGADNEDSKIWQNDKNGMWTDVDTMNMAPLLSDNGGDFNGGKAVDYDNDGDLDLFFHDHKPNAGRNTARALFRNDGNWQFTDVTDAVGIANTNEDGYDSAWGDIDLDGDMDLITSAGGGFAKRIFINDATTNGNHWLQVCLRGDSWNTRAVGARLTAVINKDEPDELRLMRLANTNIGTFNQSDIPVHFGLGSADHIDELIIRWPDGTEETFGPVSVDKYLKIHKGQSLEGDSWTIR